ncbi:MAG: hypothetical protein M1485_01615 [Chloroflexi bacterium]|nr:hypothetical protein [Chloroflexota bacterium]
MRTLRVMLYLTLLAVFAASCGPLPDHVTINFSEPTQDVSQIVQATFQAMTQQAANAQPAATQAIPTAQPVSSATQAVVPALASTLHPVAATGSISGTLMYPASGIPSLRIVAFQVGAPNYYHVDTAFGQNSYQLDNLPPGTYRVLAYTLPGGGFNPGPIGGYSQMVPCGLQYGCNDHTLIDVVVTAGHVTTGVDPNDYYAPEGTFPPNPLP